MVVIAEEAGRSPGSATEQAWTLARFCETLGELSGRFVQPFRRGAAEAVKAARSRPAPTSTVHPYLQHGSALSAIIWKEQDAIFAKDGKAPAARSDEAAIRHAKAASLDGAFQGEAAAAHAGGCAAASSSAVSRGGEGVAMDVTIWSSLPEDIIEKVLAWLPLTSVLRFRAVCRHWNSVLLSGSFLSSHSKVSLHRQPCFLLCTMGQFACTYDPSLGKWLTLFKPTSPGASVVASTGSLLCLGTQVIECRVLWVYNPITRALRHLPAMCNLCRIHKITMLEDQSTNSYTIVVAGEGALPLFNPRNFILITEVFDSQANAWHAASDPPPAAKFGSDPGAWLEGAFYCLTECPYGIIRFCLEKGMWEEVTVVMPPALSVPSLVTVRNRLMMVGICKAYPQTEEAFTIHIWELVQRPKKMSKQQVAFNSGEKDGAGVVVDSKENADVVNCGDEYVWMEVVKMPKPVSKEFLAPLASYSPFVCAGVGTSIYITTHLSPKVLVFDCCWTATSTSGDCWSWLPQDPLFPTHRSFHLLGFSFEPRFNASP